MKEKIKTIYPLLLSFFIFFPLFSVYAVEKPSCTISFEPNIIKQGKTSTNCWTTKGPITKQTFKCDGILKYMGSATQDFTDPEFLKSLNAQELINGTSNCGQIKPNKIGEGSCTFILEGPGGINSCSASIKVVEAQSSPVTIQEGNDVMSQKEQISPTEENQVPKEETQDKSVFLLSFFQNKDFQSYLIITFVFIVFLLSILLLRKKIKDIFRFKLSEITLPKIKFKQKSFAVSALVAIGIVIGVIGISYGAVYYQSSELIEKAEQLTKEEKYEEAINNLESLQNRWFIKDLGIKKHEINNEIEKNKKLLEDKKEYTQGIEEFNKANLEEAKELLSKVSEIFPYYQEAKNKIAEAQQKITEQQIAEAVEKATEEVKKKAEEAKRAAEEAQATIKEEKAKRVAAEAQRKVEGEKTKEITAELEQKIAELQQKQQFQVREGYKASEIVEHLGKYIVNVACLDRYGDATVGSGIIFALGSKGQTIILTNYHITEYADLTLEYPCAVAYSSDPTKGLTDFYFAGPVYYPSAVSLSTMRVIDFDFLSIEAKFRIPEYGGLELIPNASLKITDYFPVDCSKDKIKVGEEIVVLGYPTIGGEYLTATEGIISGFDGIYYFTTSAKIEEGSSGGGAFLKSTGCLAGMPTFVRLGRIEAFARLINIPYLEQNYLSKIWK